MKLLIHSPTSTAAPLKFWAVMGSSLCNSFEDRLTSNKFYPIRPYNSNARKNHGINSLLTSYGVTELGQHWFSWLFDTSSAPIHGLINQCWLCDTHILFGKMHFCVIDDDHDRWRHQMETFSALLAFFAGNSPVPGEFPTQRPVTRSFTVFFDRRLNKRLSKQSWGWWFETLSRSLWRHCNALQSVGHFVQASMS